MIFPERLEQGDTIGLVTPSFPLEEEKKSRCIDFFETRGYQVKLGGCAKRLDNFHNYLAGDPKERAKDINEMFADPNVKAIFCIRGGYGSAHIMKYLDFELIKKNPKIFVGFSDITNLHTAFQKFCNLVTFHGPMVSSNMLEDYDDYTSSSLLQALNMGKMLEFKNPAERSGFQVIHKGRAEGIITGGNLSLLTRAVGSFFQADTKGKILFLEDIEESIPVLDMYITQMEYAGLFDQVKGILLGDFTDCNNDRYDSTYRIEEFLQDRFDRFDVPIMYRICSGHDKPMGTIPLGTYCEMDSRSRTIIFKRKE